MSGLKRAIDGKGHAILEMPTGTGKTVNISQYLMGSSQIPGKVIKSWH